MGDIYECDLWIRKRFLEGGEIKEKRIIRMNLGKLALQKKRDRRL